MLSHPQLVGGKESWEEWAQGLRTDLRHTKHTCVHTSHRMHTAHTCTRPHKHMSTRASNTCTQHPRMNISKHTSSRAHTAHRRRAPRHTGCERQVGACGGHGEKAQGPAWVWRRCRCCGGGPIPTPAHCHTTASSEGGGCHSGFPGQLALRQGSSATPAAPLRALRFSPGLTPASTGSGW